MSLDSWGFLALTLVGVLLFHARRTRAWREGVLLGLSGAFIVQHLSAPVAAAGLLGFVGLVLVSIYAVAFTPRRGPLIVGSMAVVAAFLALKGYLSFAGVRAPESWTLTIGMSYILFRCLPTLVDLADGSLERKDIDVVTLSLYLLLFLTLPAGPIARYDGFKEQCGSLEDARLVDVDIDAVLLRVSLGYAKICMAAPVLLALHDRTIPASSALALSVAAILFVGYVYANFSGYMDVVIGISPLFGLALPENFDRPYLARNFLDLWSRWHITLSSTFQTYVFFPLVRVLRPRLGRGALPGLAGYLIVFFLLGYWHGPTSAYALFGLLLGIGAVGAKLGELFVASRRVNSVTSRLAATSSWRVLANAVALGWFAMASVAAWPSVSKAANVVSLLGTRRGGLALLLAIALVAALNVLLRLWSRLVSLAFGPVRLHPRWRPAAAGVCVAVAIAATVFAPQEFNTLVLYQRY